MTPLDHLSPKQLWRFRDKWMWYIEVQHRMKFLDDVYALVYGEPNPNEVCGECNDTRYIKTPRGFTRRCPSCKGKTKSKEKENGSS